MARDFESLIVDPSLVDPSIDAINLRTTTDTREELLSDVPEFQGIQFDPTQTSYLDDLYALYSGQLPMTPVTPAATTPAVGSTTDEGGGGGGTPATGSGGQATGGGLTQSGTFGGQPTFTTTPGTTVDNITGDITNPDGTYGGNIVDEFKTTAPQSGFLASGAAGGASLADLNLNNIDLGNPTGDSRVVSEEQGLSGTPSYVDPIMDSNLMAIRQQQNIEGLTAPEQNLVNQAFSKVGSTASDIMNDLSQIPGAVADFVNKTVDIAGQKINVGETLLKAGINKLAGGPITLVTSALGALPSSASQLEYEGYTDAQKKVIDEAYGTGGVMEGYNAVSAFGDGPLDTMTDRYNTRVGNGIIDATTTDLANKINALGGNVDNFEDGGVSGVPDAIGGNISKGYGYVDTPGGGGDPDPGGPSSPGSQANSPGNPANQGTSSSAPSRGGGQDMGGADPGGPSSPGSQANSPGNPANQGTSSGGGGGGGGNGGKIVCTMMNESYGFGSFRNKIWLKHSKDLAPEYQKGYHKIFLPLVRLSKTNKLLKKTLEHIAIHRTIDIRQESRGKVHLLGRVYRKIFEPICYIVGKYGK